MYSCLFLAFVLLTVVCTMAGENQLHTFTFEVICIIFKGGGGTNVCLSSSSKVMSHPLQQGMGKQGKTETLFPNQEATTQQLYPGYNTCKALICPEILSFKILLQDVAAK